jgi:hypothetical protein
MYQRMKQGDWKISQNGLESTQGQDSKTLTAFGIWQDGLKSRHWFVIVVGDEVGTAFNRQESYQQMKFQWRRWDKKVSE